MYYILTTDTTRVNGKFEENYNEKYSDYGKTDPYAALLAL